ncbi:hypothetical protein EC968_008326 [Mortierella alpina]|nr:hypothetical protein EC968_008326 [Mortierella alpina]
MQVLVPFWVIGLFFTALKILLVGTFGALLSIYAAFGSKYGNSIRWYRQGGYLEMVNVLRNSYQHVPRSTMVTMIVVIIASILTLFSSMYFSTMVHRSDIETNRAHIGIKTMRPLPSDGRNNQWTLYLAPGSKVEDALELMVNDTRNLGEAIPGRRYIPRKFGFEVACDTIDVVVARNLSDSLPQDAGGCSATVLIFGGSTLFDWDPATAMNVRTGPNQYTVVASVKFPKKIELLEFATYSLFFHQYMCAVAPSFSIPVRPFRKFPDSGMTSLPGTVLYKCQYPSGALNVVSQTRMNFAVRSLTEYENIIAAILDDSTLLPLLATMSDFVKNGTFSNPQINSTLVALTKADTNIHFLRCYSVPIGDTAARGLLCSYTVLEAIMTKPQPEDPIIAADLPDRPVLAANATVNENVVWVEHLPMSLTSEMPTFSASSILNATLSGAQYFASLGQNFVMDWKKGQLYVLFDTADIKDGYEFSTGLFAALIAIMVLCACVWPCTAKFLRANYTASLYRLEYTKREPHMEKPAPMVMNCTYNPLAFEGAPIVSEHGVLVEAGLQELTSRSDVRLIPPAVAGRPWYPEKEQNSTHT